MEDMNFYERLSEYYDDVFPYSAEVFDMLAKGFSPGAAVLDIACGTGSYSIPLAEAGFKVTAFDLDRVMVGKAKLKAAGFAPLARPPSFFVCSMEDMTHLPGGLFGGAFCIGNSLVHLPDAGAVSAFLKNLRTMLVLGGTAIIQIINYDRIIDKNLTGLPALTAPGVVFERNYRFSGDLKTVMFHTRLIVQREEEPEILEQEIPLLALRVSELTGMLETSGFTDLTSYGSFGGAPFDIHSSMPLIIRAKTS